MSESMIDKYGRVRARQVVADFYDTVLRSSRLAGYFESVDIHGLMKHQTAFLAAVMGAPPSHNAGQIEVAHRGLGIDPDDFEEMIRLLRASLEKHDFESEDIEVVTDRYYAFEPSVVDHGSTR